VKLSGKELARSIHGPLVKGIKMLLRAFDNHKIKHVCCSWNEVAHKIAKDSCDNKVCNFWVEVPLGYLVILGKKSTH
jgi:hypothetical protein